MAKQTLTMQGGKHRKTNHTMKNYIVQYTLANPDFGEWETEKVKATSKLEAAREVINAYGHQFRVRVGEVKERGKP